VSLDNSWLNADDPPTPLLLDDLIRDRQHAETLWCHARNHDKKPSEHPDCKALRAQIVELDALIRARREEAADPVKPSSQFQLLPSPADLLTRAFPPDEFAWGSYLPQSAACGLVGEGAVGKGHLILAVLLHVAAGLPYLGHPTKQGPVVFLSAEDAPDRIWRRVQKIVRRMPEPVQAAALANFHLFDATGGAQRLHFIASHRDAVQISDTVREVASFVLTKFGKGAVRVLAVDTVARVNPGPENANETMAAIVDAGEHIAKRTGAAVVLVHHTAKAAAREGIEDHHAGRGGGSFGDNCRSVLRLMPAQDSHCKGLAVPQEARARGDILRLVHAKNNYGPKADVVWLRRLGDGTLEQFMPEKENTELREEQMLMYFATWCERNGNKPFSMHRVRELRKEIWHDARMSKQAAEVFYRNQVEAGVIVNSAVAKPRGGFMQILNPASAKEIAKTAARLAAKFDQTEEDQ
jgi:hypothetical protein